MKITDEKWVDPGCYVGRGRQPHTFVYSENSVDGTAPLDPALACEMSISNLWLIIWKYNSK